MEETVELQSKVSVSPGEIRIISSEFKAHSKGDRKYLRVVPGTSVVVLSGPVGVSRIGKYAHYLQEIEVLIGKQVYEVTLADLYCYSTVIEHE